MKVLPKLHFFFKNYLHWAIMIGPLPKFWFFLKNDLKLWNLPQNKFSMQKRSGSPLVFLYMWEGENFGQTIRYQGVVLLKSSLGTYCELDCLKCNGNMKKLKNLCPPPLPPQGKKMSLPKCTFSHQHFWPKPQLRLLKFSLYSKDKNAMIKNLKIKILICFKLPIIEH